MTINLVTRKGNKLQLNGDVLSGDTYPIKDFIKKNMDGKWIADQKAWKVNAAKVNWLVEKFAGIRIDTDAAPVQAQPKLMSYSDFLRNADNPNSDY